MRIEWDRVVEENKLAQTANTINILFIHEFTYSLFSIIEIIHFLRLQLSKVAVDSESQSQN